MLPAGPRRIVCLTEETTETLYLLGEEARIVGISGFTVRPPRARREKPRVSAFLSAKIDRILALEPDLVLGFSNLQADIASQLIRAGVAVHVFNHRRLPEIFEMIRTVGALVGCEGKTAILIDELADGVARVAADAAALPERPCIYFEEWDDPMISAIGWVSDLIEVAGGRDCFREFAAQHAAGERIVRDPAEVVRRAPDIIVGSWCGKKFRPERVAARHGWACIPAVANGEIHEIKSADILQPGPAALTDGLRQLADIVSAWAARR
ncbi:MAG: ABC transporter substrate-binding protein [Rhodocyclaceae bacterium]|nr:ABC transporter substrate-binding protein [Rhodocyclaceae bacterium]